MPPRQAGARCIKNNYRLHLPHNAAVILTMMFIEYIFQESNVGLNFSSIFPGSVFRIRTKLKVPGFSLSIKVDSYDEKAGGLVT